MPNPGFAGVRRRQLSGVGKQVLRKGFSHNLSGATTGLAAMAVGPICACFGKTCYFRVQIPRCHVGEAHQQPAREQEEQRRTRTRSSRVLLERSNEDETEAPPRKKQKNDKNGMRRSMPSQVLNLAIEKAELESLTEFILDNDETKIVNKIENARR